MKKTMKKLLALVLALVMVMALTACGQQKAQDNDNSGDTGAQITLPVADGADIGSGAASFTTSVTGKDGKTISFTVHTDKETVGEALLELGIIAGDTSEYGLYVKSVNGETADYDTDGAYWAFYIGDQYAPVGVDLASIEEGTTYGFAVEKAQ